MFENLWLIQRFLLTPVTVMAASEQSINSLISNDSYKETNYDGGPIYYYCNLKAPRWTSWTASNPGRMFYRCPRFNVSGILYCHDFG